VSDLRLGAAIRAIRRRRKWRLVDLGQKAGVSASFVSRLERGHVGTQSVDSIRAVAGALDMRVDLTPRWRAGELDRLLNARHSELHEAIARWFKEHYPAWVLAPEVSFAIYGERGVIDILAWHPGRRALLVIELKTALVDINELVGTLDRKRRLAGKIVRDRGWDPVIVGAWLIVADSRTNRRRLAAHRTMLEGALPDTGRTVPGWLRDPARPIGAVSFWRLP
jgi:transcriptional regulator with XRE-family HTH domain